MPVETFTQLYGNWVGELEVTEADFERFKGQTISKLNIVIKQISDSGVVAQSIVNGNSRLMTGTMKHRGDVYDFVLTEPGDHKYDGKFSFVISNDTLSGTWQPYDTSLATKLSKFMLVKKSFVYDATVRLPRDWAYIDYVTFKEVPEYYEEEGKVDSFINTVYRAASEKVYELNASTKKLSEKDVKDLRKLDLEILRNTVFARHGYSFKSRVVRQFFDQVDWYVPLTDNIERDLTALEKENIKLLTRFEKYAADHYDTFGR